MGRFLALAVAVLCCLGLFVGVGAAAHDEPDRVVLAFELDADGDAVVYHVTDYDPNRTERYETYQSYANNSTRRTELRDRVVSEWRREAAKASNRTHLDMRVHNTSVRAYERQGYGRVVVRAEWENLAFADQTRVVVTEPFRQWEPDREVAIHGPEGYERGFLQPSPVRARPNSALWNPRTSNFSKFYAEFRDPDAQGTATAAPDDKPRWSGAGTFLRALLIALVPVALVLLAVRRRQ